MNSLKYQPLVYPKSDVLFDKLRSKVDAAIQRLQRMQYVVDMPVKPKNLETILAKFTRIFNGDDIKLSVSEKQTISYHIVKLKREEQTFFLTTYLNKEWSPLIIKGLIHSLLLGWYNEYAQLLRDVLLMHKSEFSNIEKSALGYMDSEFAPKKLANYLRNHQIKLESATDFVLLNHHLFVYPYRYFEEVMLSYFSHQSIDEEYIKYIELATTTYNSHRFNRIIFPEIIIRTDLQKGIKEQIKQTLIDTCFRMVGDPNIITNWQDDTLTEQQRNNLLQARNILRKWILSKAIESVFTKIGGGIYSDRAEFWTKYVPMLEMDEKRNTFFRILSTGSLVGVLSQYVRNTYYKRLRHGSSNTALLMRFERFTVVEFLDGGCMYLYHYDPAQSDAIDSYRYAHIWSNQIDRIEELKMPNITELSKNDVFSRHPLPNTLKIAHRGAWENTFTHLLRIKGIICKE